VSGQREAGVISDGVELDRSGLDRCSAPRRARDVAMSADVLLATLVLLLASGPTAGHACVDATDMEEWTM